MFSNISNAYLMQGLNTRSALNNALFRLDLEKYSHTTAAVMLYTVICFYEGVRLHDFKETLKMYNG